MNKRPSHGHLNTQGVKLELFIFDTFPLAKRVALLEVHRHEEFAPVKNAPGSASDSPDTARQAILKLHTKCDPLLTARFSCADLLPSRDLSLGQTFARSPYRSCM